LSGCERARLQKKECNKKPRPQRGRRGALDAIDATVDRSHMPYAAADLASTAEAAMRTHTSAAGTPPKNQMEAAMRTHRVPRR